MIVLLVSDLHLSLARALFFGVLQYECIVEGCKKSFPDVQARKV